MENEIEYESYVRSSVTKAVTQYSIGDIDRQELESVILENVNIFLGDGYALTKELDEFFDGAWSTTTSVAT